MGLLEKTRVAVANKLLTAELRRKRIKHETVTFEEAKEIGLLFSVSQMDDLHTAISFKNELEESGKKVTTLGVVRLKDFEKTHAAQFPDVEFIPPKSLNYLLKPSGPQINKFVKHEFDLLISLNLTNHFALSYISGFSKAKLRVGPYNPGNILCYDFMIRPNPHATLSDLISEIRHYLNIIKK